MSSIAKVNISLSKKDLTKSRIPPVASRNVVFYHKATAGQLTINLLSLTTPSSEMPTIVQATAAEISGAQLSVNKKNLDLISAAKGPLVQGLDYVVVDSYTISLIGPYQTVGAEAEEIFIGTINSAPISDLVVASAKSVFKTYELAVGQTILNLGYEYQTGVNPSDDIGIIKVFVNGTLARRGVDYDEVDAGSGYGTTIQFKVAPVSIPHKVIVDFGVMSITDNNAIGTIESIAGSIKKIADDLSVVAGTSAEDYLNASPSEVERRTFGDSVLSMLSKSFYIQNFQTSGFSGAGTKGSNNALRYASVLSSVTSEGSGLYAITDDATNGTRITILKKCKITISTSNGGTTISRGYGINKNGSVMINGAGVVTTSADRGACSITTVGNVNDFFDVRSTESGFTGGELIVFAEELGNTLIGA
jgi:hypothetical protein